MTTSAPNIFLAFLAGLASFLSPCVLPLVPAYIGYMSGSALAAARGKPAPAGPRRAPAPGTQSAASPAPGTQVAMATSAASAGAAPRASAPRMAPADTTAQLSTASARAIVMVHALLFVLGLTFVFVVVIGGLAGFLSEFLRDNKREVQYVMGAMLVIFGLHMAGVINLPFMNYTRRFDMKTTQNVSYLRSLLIGMGFGIGWTPCIGPVLSSIFFLSVNGRQGEAFPLFLAYSLGLGVPFLITAYATGQISGWLKKITRRSFTFKIGNFTILKQVNSISLVSGLLLIFMGVLIFTNSLAIIAPAVTWFEGL
jgi:cytochrome c-type biogenesis protein